MAIWDIGGIIGGIGKLWGSIFGSKETTEKNTSREKTTAQEALIEEAKSSVRRTDFFTVFVEGINRLVRPTFSYGTVAFFVWAVVDPINFTVSMQALALVPDFMYGIFLTIVGFWFGGRILEKYADRRLQGPTAAQLQEVLDNQKKILNANGMQVTYTPPAHRVLLRDEPVVVNQPPPQKPKYTMEPIYEEDEKRPEK
jgi:hypothetical protein